MTPIDTSPVPAPRGAAPGDRPAPGAWLSRRDWRRAVDRWIRGGMDHAELEALKARLVRRRAGPAGLEPPGARPAARPALRLLHGGGGRRTRPPGGGPDPGSGRAA